jgi:hypothetical protein
MNGVCACRCDHVTNTFEDAENDFYQSGGTGH